MELPTEECPTYYNQYLKWVENDILSELKNQLADYPQFLSTLPKEKELFRYAPGKWSLKEVVGHITDTERILANRALRIARNDQTPIPGFDENAYVVATDFNALEMKTLIADFIAVRKSNISLFCMLKETELKRIGTASQKSVSARALFYFMVGHLRHHENLIKERYLQTGF